MLFLRSMDLLDLTLVLARPPRVVLPLNVLELGTQLVEAPESLSLDPALFYCRGDGTAGLAIMTAVTEAATGRGFGYFRESPIERAFIYP